ncbi:MAG: hypothetical protein AB4372_21615 [Xenococcus sp. (in: cyanobacteria)]
MSNNLSIERGTEKFSFIYTLTVYYPRHSDPSGNYQPCQDSQKITKKNISQHSLPDSYQEQLIASSDSQHFKQSSALSKTDNYHTNSLSLAIANPTTIINDWYALEADDEYELDLLSLDASVESGIENNSTKKKIVRDQLLLFASGGYLIFVFWWLFAYTTGQDIIPFLASNRETIPKADVEFIDYIQRSLETIDRQVIAQEKTYTSEEDPTVVYVPVYTQAATNPISRYAPPPLPQAIPLPPPAPSEFTAVQPPTKIPLPPPPSESTNLKIAETPQPKNNKVATAINTPKVNSTLVGLIELGEASAALFKVDGITQRIWLGENIESTGWILESVTKEKATITNQGRSRILSIGESL